VIGRVAFRKFGSCRTEEEREKWPVKKFIEAKEAGVALKRMRCSKRRRKVRHDLEG